MHQQIFGVAEYRDESYFGIKIQQAAHRSIHPVNQQRQIFYLLFNAYNLFPAMVMDSSKSKINSSSTVRGSVTIMSDNIHVTSSAKAIASYRDRNSHTAFTCRSGPGMILGMGTGIASASASSSSKSVHETDLKTSIWSCLKNIKFIQ